MSTFNLPDLGEGLQEAELVSWHVNVGDHVVADQPLVSVETAKAVVEIPSPYSGRIARLIGEPGDIIKVGAPIVEFTDDGVAHQDAGTVVGTLPTEAASEKQPHSRAVVGGAEHGPMKASPAARTLAHEPGISLGSVEGTGLGAAMTRGDIEAKATSKPLGDGYELLRGVRRAMAINMARSALEVASSTVSDEVLIGHWPKTTDVTVRLIRAVIAGCRAEPALNAWFDKARMARKFHTNIDLALAMNIGDGLFAPVLRDVAARTDHDIRASIEALKQDIVARKVEPATLTGPTITLSNFGMLGGREASLAIVPPQVAILGAGRIFDTVHPVNGELRITKALPLSLTFDHRVVTGAEAVRFLSAAIAELAKPA